MRSLHLLALAAAIAAAGTACGGDNGGGNGPDNVAPTATFTAPTCVVQTPCTFTDASTDSDGSIASRTWTFPDGTPPSSTQATQAVTFATAGAKSVTLSVTDNEGATDDVQVQVTVTEGGPPPQNQAPTAGFTVTCASLECTFTNTSTDVDGTFTSSWNFDDGSAPSTEANPVHTYSVTELTTFDVVLTVTDDDGASDSETVQVTVAPPATLTCGSTPDCSLTLDVPSKVTVTLVSSDCELAGNTFKVTVTPPGGGTPVEETLFTDGCNTPDNTSFQLQSDATFAAGTQITAQVTSGGATLEIPPAIRVSGVFPEWTLEFDDGARAVEPPAPGPDFDDLIIRITATPQ